GILYGKDLLRFVCGGVPEGLALSDITRKPMFVPKSINCSKVFTEMTANKTQLAIVVDEYGGTEGIITLEDLLESIVGDIQDEYDEREETELTETAPGQYTVIGSMNLDDLSEATGLKLESEDYDTIGGYLLGLFDHLPRKGERYVSKEGVIFTVIDVKHRRIEKVSIRIPQPESGESKD
ncbi:MAG: transporter associated domain-containing protein, partial [Candidatus Weimeria sp.]